MSIGDIHWVDLPAVGGREQHGRRPAIVVQDEAYGGKLPTVLVVPLTSTKKALRFAGTTLVSATVLSGLRNDSVALAFQCQAIDRKRLRDRLGQVTDEEKEEVLAELFKLFGRAK